MDNTRVFISGLPPTLTNDELRKHFSARFEVTDAHVIPNRRIGFVGFKSGSFAQDAIKYFNKSYIRMSKIALELARPVRQPFLLILRPTHPLAEADWIKTLFGSRLTELPRSMRIL